MAQTVFSVRYEFNLYRIGSTFLGGLLNVYTYNILENSYRNLAYCLQISSFVPYMAAQHSIAVWATIPQSGAYLMAQQEGREVKADYSMTFYLNYKCSHLFHPHKCTYIYKYGHSPRSVEKAREITLYSVLFDMTITFGLFPDTNLFPTPDIYFSNCSY